jgi:hypothetical protein
MMRPAGGASVAGKACNIGARTIARTVIDVRNIVSSISRRRFADENFLREGYERGCEAEICRWKLSDEVCSRAGVQSIQPWTRVLILRETVPDFDLANRA